MLAFTFFLPIYSIEDLGAAIVQAHCAKDEGPRIWKLLHEIIHLLQVSLIQGL